MDALKRAGIYDNTLIVFTTDNGGQASSGSSNYPLKGNKNTFYEAGKASLGFKAVETTVNSQSPILSP